LPFSKQASANKLKMAETLVKEKVCRACGADVRPQALFCYNCGSAVAPNAPLIRNNNKKVENDWFQDEPVEEEFKTEDEIIADEETDAEENSEFSETEEIAEDEKAEKRDLSKMDSAAQLRRRGKSIQKKRVEIVWEEHDNAPNGWFIFFAVVLTILAVVIWIISTYLE
jgi:ribosomal protein L40E